MELSPFPGKLHLALSLGVTFYLILAVRVITIVTTHTFLIILALLVLLGNRHPTGMALIIAALLQIVVDGYPIVEDKALALPFAFCFGYLLQVLQNTTLEMVNLFKTLLPQIGSGFFAANASGTKHGDFLMPRRIKIFLYILGKFPEGICLGIHRVFESTDFNFIFITRVQ